MRIYMLRHAEAQPLEEVDRDEDRALTARGIINTRKICKGLRRLDIFPERIFCSPFKRAVKTANDIAEELGYVDGIEPVEELVPKSDPQEIIEFLKTLAVNQVMLIGHQPMLGQIVSILIGTGISGRIAIKKCGLVRVDVENWQEDPAGRLKWLFTGKQLRWFKKKKNKGDKGPL